MPLWKCAFYYLEQIHPVATGPAAEIVAAHQAPQSIEFYSGYDRR